ncbi:DMT family transporter [Polaromonas sp.]|uniref:DMT family transporter n=1 Tax=Polaromonas sp. TaxID=1869339 RepID=UPI00356164EE
MTAASKVSVAKRATRAIVAAVAQGKPPHRLLLDKNPFRQHPSPASPSNMRQPTLSVSHSRSLLLLLAAGTTLGLTSNLAKIAGENGLPPLAFLAWSVSGAALILLVIAAVRGLLPALNARTLEYFVVAAFFTVAGSNLLFFSAVEHVGASFVALAITFPPLLTYLGALLFGVERFSTLRAAGVVLALAGAAVLAAFGLSSPDASARWILITLCGPVLLAAGNLYRTLRWPENEHPEGLASGMLITAAAMLVITGFMPGFSLAVPHGSALPYLLIGVQTGLFAAQFLLLLLLQKSGGPVLLSLLGSVGAVVGVPVAILFLNEAPPRGLVYAVPLITIGVALVAWGGMKEATA